LSYYSFDQYWGGERGNEQQVEKKTILSGAIRGTKTNKQTKSGANCSQKSTRQFS
jgi:hypothetical protein